jgi:hypothetical protein
VLAAHIKVAHKAIVRDRKGLTSGFGKNAR